jgi:two-component system, chemotaxis family, sensor kinase CheA
VVEKNAQDSKLFDTFIQDSSAIIGNLNKILIELETGPEREELVHDAFREIHSLKSEAAYLHLDEIAKNAHDFESKLSAVREGKTPLTPDLINTFFSTIDTLQTALQGILKKAAHHGDEGKNREDGARAGDEKEALPSAGVPAVPAENGGEQLLFSEFEKALLQEARLRGERFYRVVCELEENIPMKFPRVFLLINNLELLVNVIMINPQPENLDEDETELTIYFTTAIEEKKIYDALNVDEVRRVQIAALDYGTYLITQVEEDITAQTGESVPEPSYLRIETAKIDDLVTAVGELQLRVGRLGKNPKQENEVAKVHELADELRRILRTIRLVPVKSESNRLRRFARDFSKTCGKQIQFSLIGGSIEVDRALLEMIVELLIHLIRNSIDHGIENPNDRTAAGKEETAHVVVAAVESETQLVFQIIDDGRGVDKDSLFTEEEDDSDLFSLLSRPGFTTSEQVTDYSGRGVGLDIVRKKVAGIEGAEARMISRFGEGSVVTLAFPGGFALNRLLLIKAGEKTVAVPKRGVGSIETIESDGYTSDDEGSLLYKGLPVFTLKGRLHFRNTLPDEPYALVMQHLNTKAYLLAEEVLFEKEVPETQFKLSDEVGPHLYRVSIGEVLQDFFYLHPAFIAQ